MNVGECNVINDAMKIEDNFECRACLQTFGAGADLINIFEAWDSKTEGMQETIAKDLSKIANIQISETDLHSKLICQICHERLRQACTFAALVHSNNLMLRQRLPSFDNDTKFTEIWPKPIQLDKNVNENIYDMTNVEIKQEVLSDDDNMDTNGLDEGYRDDFINCDIKIEPEEIIDTKTPPIVNGTIPEKYLENITLMNGTTSDTHENIEQDAEIKEEFLSEEEEQCPEVADLPLDCMLCMKSFNSLSGLKVHVITHHSYKSVKRKSNSNPSPAKKQNNRHYCTICRRAFMTSTDLIVHETCHNKFVCYGCNDKFDSFDLLAKHRKSCTSISSEAKKPLTLDDVKRPKLDKSEANEEEASSLQCKICNETFTDSYYMSIHQEIHHTISRRSVESVETTIPMATDALESIFTEN